MPEIIEYCIKFSISLAMVYLFYAGFLRRLTFHYWNRWYLLLYSSLAFLIAFIDISPFIQKNQLDASQVIQFIPLFDKYTVGETVVNVDHWGVWDWTLLSLVIGISIMLARMAVQYFSITRMRSKAKLLLDHPIKVYQVDANIIPFSFGNSIFINQDLHAEEELKEIIRHEFIHIRQKHSVDMIWGELLCIFNWYNPFAWLIRRSIRQNLEFIADDKVLRNGVDRKQYQYLLLKIIGVSQFSIANQFNFSSLKKRIAMMNKMRTARVHLVKFLFIIPFVLVLLLAFRSQQQSDTIPPTVDLGIDTIPTKYKALPKEFEDIHIISKSKEKVINGKKVTVSEPETVIITLKDGKKETYGFNIPADLEAFEKKYKRTLDSILPPPPPPPPSIDQKLPPPPPPPGVPEAVPPPTKDGAPNKAAPSGSKGMPLPPPAPVTPDVKELPVEIEGIHLRIDDPDLKEYTVTIKRKDGKIETYDLKVDKDLKEFEKKYGRRLEDLMPDTPVPPGQQDTKWKPTPAKPGSPAKSGPPSKTGTPSKPDIKGAPSKPLDPPVKDEEGDLNDLKIDASLDNPGNAKAGISIRHDKSVSVRNWLNVKNDIIVIVDGKEYKWNGSGDFPIPISPEDIESITVLKNESAVKAYGERAKDGVLIITTKKKESSGKDTSRGRDIITRM